MGHHRKEIRKKIVPDLEEVLQTEKGTVVSE